MFTQHTHSLAKTQAQAWSAVVCPRGAAFIAKPGYRHEEGTLLSDNRPPGP